MLGNLHRQAIVTVLTVLMMVMGGATSFSQTVDAPASVNPAPKLPANPAPSARGEKAKSEQADAKTVIPHDCTRFELATKAYKDGRCTKAPAKPEEPATGTVVAHKEIKNQCNLTNATKKWAAKLADVRQVSTSLDRIINNVLKDDGNYSGEYKDENFGDTNHWQKIALNRVKAKNRFLKARKLIQQVTRRVAGDANQACRNCYTISDWNLLRSAAEFVYQSQYFEEPKDRIGAGRLVRTPEVLKSSVKIDEDTIVKTNAQITEEAPTLNSPKIELKKISRSMFNCLIRKVNKADETASNLGFVEDITQTLCDGHKAWRTDKGDEVRKKMIRDIQSNFNHLFDYLDQCRDPDGSQPKKMSKLQKDISCQNEDTRDYPDFFIPAGRFGTASEICKWHNAQTFLSEIEKADNSQ